MQVQVIFTPDCEDDGFVGSTTVTRNYVIELSDLSNAFRDATNAAGYTYVEDVGFEKDDGTMVFGGY
tara:strand:+ start:875 stop:1075 length:201 start_codon:yes stop_codon:yes gene_type:complete